MKAGTFLSWTWAVDPIDYFSLCRRCNVRILNFAWNLYYWISIMKVDDGSVAWEFYPSFRAEFAISCKQKFT